MLVYDRTIEIRAAPARVYAVAADHGRYAAYGIKYLVSVRVDRPEGPDGWTESSWVFHGAGLHLEYGLRAHHDPERLEIRFQALPNRYAQNGSGFWRFLPDGNGGTRFVAHMEMELVGGLLGALFAPLLRPIWNDVLESLARVSATDPSFATGPSSPGMSGN